MGKDIGLLTPHHTYLALGETTAQRIIRYRKLFADVIPLDTLDQIRECTNKSWVLGSSKFKAQIESAANRRIDSLGRGGDRKSKRVIDQGVCRTNTSCRCVLRLSDSIVILIFPV